MKVFEWLKQSNRWLHFILGLGILVINLAINVFLNINIIESLIICTINTFIVMLALEAKDVQNKNKFDWLDVLAGMIGSIIAYFVVILYYIYLWIIF